MAKAIGCVSGGLDSQLAACLLLDQGVEVVALHARHLWHNVLPGEDRRPVGLADLEARGVPIRYVDAAEADVRIVRRPRHGMGKLMNPCIDCRIWTLKEAGCLMRKEGADFVFTGEVLGQRPMSQHRQAIRTVEVEAGLEGLVLRPLCAKRLEPTQAERDGLVDRDRLLGLQGRSRRVQLELAERFGITEYQTPAGGCLLTDPGYAFRLRELMEHEELSVAGAELLKVGRHFRLADGSRLVVGRHQADNERLEGLFVPGDVRLEAAEMTGPLSLVRGPASDEALATAAGLTLRYGKGKPGEVHPVRVTPAGGEPRVLRVPALGDDVARPLMIAPEARP